MGERLEINNLHLLVIVTSSPLHLVHKQVICMDLYRKHRFFGGFLGAGEGVTGIFSFDQKLFLSEKLRVF